MNAQIVKDKLINDIPTLIEILEQCGFRHVKRGHDEIRCAYSQDSNPSRIKIDTRTMVVTDFVLGITGDIYTLIQTKRKCTFREAFQFVSSFIDLGDISFGNNRRLFGGFFQKSKSDIYVPKIYDDTHLERSYEKIPNQRFLNDGIPITVQDRFDLHYDELSNRIIVPYHTELGLVGTVGRYNGNHEKDGVSKWMATDPFSKAHFLYGLHHNYNQITTSKWAFIGESEKFPMQLSAMGIDLGVAVGSHSISTYQAAQLKYITDKLVVCFDEGLDEEVIREQCKKLQRGLFNNVKVGYVYDKNNQIMMKDSKVSPSDLGKAAFQELIKNHVTWL